MFKVDEKGDVVMHVDGAYTVHNDGKVHSVLFLTIGKGAMTNVSKKLGFVTTSSTEPEIVADGERFPKCTWFRHFTLAQGANDSKKDSLMQDNESCILLHKNCPYSNKKGYKHTHVWYFCSRSVG